MAFFNHTLKSFPRGGKCTPPPLKETLLIEDGLNLASVIYRNSVGIVTFLFSNALIYNSSLIDMDRS